VRRAWDRSDLLFLVGQAPLEIHVVACVIG
jgi:hypothetical protein